jgi:carotenoid 1,2-hydratase
VGSVFSPYYAWRGYREPLDHCAINVALYGEAGARWAMTERGRRHVRRSATSLSIGPSALAWRDGALEITLDEIGAPLPKRVRGTIRVTPQGMPRLSFPIDEAGRHVWQPIAPRARIAVALDVPALRWEGDAYLDGNVGTEPLATCFTGWTWARAHVGDDTVTFYDAERRDGSSSSLALRFGADGATTAIVPPAPATLPKTLWRLPRSARVDGAVGVRRTLEDTPFYARTWLRGELLGVPADIIHETLSLDRLQSRLVQAMLPFRMVRRPF